MSESLLASMIVAGLLLVVAAGGLVGYQYKSNADRAVTAESQVAIQSTVIQAMQDQDEAFRSISSETADKNTKINAKSEETVIEYRTILRKENTCDLPVPADVSDGLLRYTNRLRSAAMQTAPGRADEAGVGAIAPGRLTYCQAVLWINPLLTAIEEANNQLSAIRLAENHRQGKHQ